MKFIKERMLVDREIYLEQTYLINELIATNMDDFSTTDIKNYTTHNGDPKEVLEWHAITSWLLDRLSHLDEVVIDNVYGDWWGRCKRGKSIHQDEIIVKLIEDSVKFDKLDSKIQKSIIEDLKDTLE